jgi:hypothetical protein
MQKNVFQKELIYEVVKKLPSIFGKCKVITTLTTAHWLILS